MAALDTADRDYLAQVVSARTGVAPDVVQKRVDDAYASAVSAIDTARQGRLLLPVLLPPRHCCSSLAAAWYAAQRGGSSP